ncbi:MAG: hypothetical protein A2Y84_01390, partial [Candidatus Colwellbacteria bacterium RBG_13_48_8]
MGGDGVFLVKSTSLDSSLLASIVVIINSVMHQIQFNILRTLLFKEGSRFADLNTDRISNDHFTFHLKRLVEQGLVEKTKEGLYGLTISGKEYANRLDTDAEKVNVEKQAKIGALIVGVDRSGEKAKYLIQQRLKQPFYGFYGFVSGKIKWGETVYEAARRELEEETGLKGDMALVGIEHKMDYSNEDTLLEDKYFYIFRVENPEGDFIESFEGGKNIWLTKEEISNIPELFDDVMKVVGVIERGEFTFFEDKYK